MLSTRPSLLEIDKEELLAVEIIYKSKFIGLTPQWQVSDQMFPLYYFDSTFLVLLAFSPKHSSRDDALTDLALSPPQF